MDEEIKVQRLMMDRRGMEESAQSGHPVLEPQTALTHLAGLVRGHEAQTSVEGRALLLILLEFSTEARK